MKRRLGYLLVFPWEFERLGAGVQSMLGFIVAIGVGIPALRDLGWISGSAWHLLIMVPVVGAVVAIEKMQARHKRTVVELEVARALLRMADSASEADSMPRQQQDES